MIIFYLQLNYILRNTFISWYIFNHERKNCIYNNNKVLIIAEYHFILFITDINK
jgi:hypothetical protein